MALNKNIIITAFCALSLHGCAVGPDFMRPTVATGGKQYLNQPDNTQATEDMTKWWDNIQDPLLQSYVDQLLNENLQLKQAGERILQARARTTIQGGDLYPSLSTTQSASRGFTPGQENNIFGTGGRQYTTSYNAELNASWQIDLFGRVRRSLESARSGFEASLYDRDALTQSLIAELVQTRVNIATNQELLSLAQQNTQNRQNLYTVVKRRYDVGTGSVTVSDVYLAENNYNASQSDVFQFERLIAEDSYRLDVLLGQTPGATDATKVKFPVLPPPQTQAVCLPADLLDRRPDLRASELRLKSANANIGVAVADLYPNITLGGSIGVSDNSLSDLFTADRLVGSLLGSITTRIFEGGKLRANIDLREAEARELSAAYAENILNALREVETALNAEEKITRDLNTRTSSLNALKKAEESAQTRYLAGIETLQNYLNIQQQRYQTEQALLNTKREKWQARIALYLALGGDWLGQNEALSACTQKQKTTPEEAKEI